MDEVLRPPAVGVLAVDHDVEGVKGSGDFQGERGTSVGRYIVGSFAGNVALF